MLSISLVTSVRNLSVSGRAKDKLKDALTPVEELLAKRVCRKTAMRYLTS